MNISTKKDWFEFILDLNLLDKHLSNDQGYQGKFYKIIIRFRLCC